LATGNFAETIGRYANEVIRLYAEERDAITERNRRINEKTYFAVADPAKNLVQPNLESPAPTLGFDKLRTAVARLQQSARNYDDSVRQIDVVPRVQQSLDGELRKIEQTLIEEHGLPRRPWYRHAIYAPGFYTGYGAKTLPGIREAIEEHRWTDANDQIAVVSAALDRAATQIDRATAILRSTR
jgi:N-acetylated-alpha-linked acidic dipeptidase